MKILKYISFLILSCIVLFSCASTLSNSNNSTKEEPVVIANDSLEYEIIIIDPGFSSYLASVAKPEGFYDQNYLEARNKVWVITWNQRAQNPTSYNQGIYENIIDYNSNIDYGYEVNYKLFNYFLFAQRKYKMSLGGGFRTGRIN
ncbi:hypothetical protein BXQ17_13540 [Polaribacter sp. BM10]|uniref:DUF6146 family protein n=1 Tax=Polaribacter sp. BM10 TaxID=1529069 RepID=UPI00098AAFC9|nr:DUF6146 family protein [Polaribacter sp. BM10]AQS95039.1 hypothetical protein BXQ17_13540 [Polaribacter sp. BM10]